LTLDEVNYLKQLVDCVDAGGRVLNVGAGAGTSALAMAEDRPDLIIVSVDIDRDNQASERRVFAEAGINNRLIQLAGDSRSVAAVYADEPFDLVFIDDGHLEPEIAGDIAGWFPHVKMCGIMAFHDYTSKHWPDVKKVVDAMLAGQERLELVDTLIAFQKIDDFLANA
jgi:predicted O-methyltransferase YrrM